MESVYDLAYWYLQTFFPNEELTKREKKQVIDEMRAILDEGWTSKEIREVLEKEGVKTLFPSALFRDRKPSVWNLLDSNAFYLHPQLRIMPGPPKRIIDYNKGTIKKITEPYFLEMRASYTLNDLVRYYEDQHNLKLTDDEREQCRGAFRYLLKNFSVDEILFMIDVAANHIRDHDLPPLENPLELKKFAKEAREEINAKRTEERLAGNDRIVPRKRVPLGRRRR